MPAPVRAGLARLGAIVGGFSIAQRVLTLLGVAVLAVGIVAVGAWLSKPAYTPLFSGLSGADASAVVEQLRGSNVPYQLAEGGSTVLVPEEVVYEERIKAASAGLPVSSTGGYALLDSMGVTTSAFQQSVTYKRAIEGELAKTISSIQGVSAASVQLALPEETVFVSEQQKPTASVFVETASGATLSTSQVNAIVHLTSAAVEGMDAEGVAVIDAEGNVLSAVGVGPSGTVESKTGDYEQRVSASVQEMLDRIVGSGNATVAVAATISSESAEVTSERFEAAPETPALNESVNTENYTGTDGAAAGVLGPDNIAVPGGAGGDGTYTSEETVRNNAVDKVTETRTIPAGAVAKQTVSVAIDRASAGDIRLAEVRDLVASAAGIDAERGDELSVELVEFSTADAAAAGEALRAAERQAEEERLAELIRAGIIAAAVLVPLVIAAIVIARRLRPRREPLELEESHPHFDVLDGAAASAPTVPLELEPPDPDDGDARRADIARMAEQDPEKTAQLLRAMLDERTPA
ncbi:MAG: flagellar basal-body MS-ring/collar protein FliF [Agromyces sp.]